MAVSLLPDGSPCAAPTKLARQLLDAPYLVTPFRSTRKSRGEAPERPYPMRDGDETQCMKLPS